jgi:AAA+ ATPase superfamily predicted ATPase
MQLTSDDLIAAIAEHLAGRLSIAQLADWAFDRFYSLEQEELIVPAAEEEVIREVLDELMFADDEAFALTAEELQRLMDRLAQL